MTAKQKAARAKFKAVVQEAKKLRAKNPKLTQAQAVKQAWAISYSKKAGKIADVHVTYPSKKEAEYKMKRYKDGTFKGNERIAAAPKKKAAKKTVKKSAAKSYHKDTASHNVKISVMSGMAGIKSQAKKLLTDQYGKLAAKKLLESTKRGKKAIQKQMSNVATKLKKVHSF